MTDTDLADVELKDLVAQMLENNGILGKIRAELRANVFLALKEQDTTNNKMPIVNNELKQFLSTKEGSLVFSLVRDFLEFFNLEHTLSILDSESGTEKTVDRHQLFEGFGLTVADGFPVLTEVLQSGRNNASANPVAMDTAVLNQDSNTKDDKVAVNSVISDPTGVPADRNLMSNDKDSVEKSDTSLSNDSDAIFDEPVPRDKSCGLFSFTKQANYGNEDADGNSDMLSLKNDCGDESRNSAGNLTELKDLPSLPGVEKKEKTAPGWDDLAAIDKRIADLGFEIPQDGDYDDDFSSTTTRDKSDDHLNTEHSIEEEIDAVEELPNSQSEAEDLTSDRTISQIDQLSGIDYVENLA